MRQLANVARLVLRSQPEQDERLPGYALRLMSANRCGADVKHISLRKSLSVPKNVQTVADLFGLTPQQIISLAYFTSTTGKIAWSNQELRPRNLVLTNPKICPACLHEREVLPSYWDLRCWIVCPHHQIELQSQCPSCGESLNWNRRSLALCQCGAALRDFARIEASDAEGGLAALLARAADYPQPASKTPLRGPFEELTLGHLSDFIMAVGALSLPRNQYRHGGNRFQLATCRLLIGHAAETMSDWPSALDEVIFKRLLSDPVRTSHDFIEGLLYRSPLAAPQFRFMKDAVEPWYDYPPMSGAELADPPAGFNFEARYTSLAAAFGRLNCDRLRLRSLLRNGEFPGFALRREKNECWFVDEDWLEARLQEGPAFASGLGYCHGKAALKVLGLKHRSILMDLAEAGLIRRTRIRSKDAFETRTLTDLLTRLEAIASQNNGPSDGNPSRFESLAHAVSAILSGDCQVAIIRPEEVGLARFGLPAHDGGIVHLTRDRLPGEFIRVGEACDTLNISERRLRQLVREGWLARLRFIGPQPAQRTLDRASVTDFGEKFMLSGAASVLMGVPEHLLVTFLQGHSVVPVDPPVGPSSRVPVWDRPILLRLATKLGDRTHGITSRDSTSHQHLDSTSKVARKPEQNSQQPMNETA